MAESLDTVYIYIYISYDLIEKIDIDIEKLCILCERKNCIL